MFDRMPSPLRFRHALQHRESAHGFASRLAALNGRRMSQLLRDMRIKPHDLDQGAGVSIRKVAALGDADGDALMRFTAMPTDRKGYSVLNGEMLGYRALNRTFFRFCPACALEDMETFQGPENARPWLRIEWTIGHFRSCSKHGLYLTSTTPTRRRFEPFDFSETMGNYLSELDRMVLDSNPAPLSPFQAWLSDRLDGRRGGAEWLDALPLHVAADWCEVLGVSCLHPPKVQTSKLTEFDWAAAADEGFRIASAGESAILALLADLNDAQKDTRGFWGLRDTYGVAYGHLQKTVADPGYLPIRDLVRDFANDTIPIEPGTDVLGVVIDTPKVLTIHTAARTSGASPRSMRTLFERQGINQNALDAGMRNHRVTTASAEVAVMVEKLRNAYSAPALMKRLGIPRNHLQALIAIGALKTATGSENHANAKHRFARVDVDDMMFRLFDGAVEVHNPGPRQLTIMDARHAAGTSLDNVLSMIFDNKLKWKGHLKGSREYGSVLVDADEVTSMVRIEAPMVNLRRQDVPDAIPGLSVLSIDFFLRQHLLEEDTEFSPGARRAVPVITRESAEAFRARFVTLGELRQVSGLHVKQVKLLLKGADIEAVFDPELSGIYLYDRGAVDQVLAERPRFWIYDKAKAKAAAV